MNKVSEVIVLGEDRRHQNFARRFLERLGFKAHHIFLRPVRAGGGSGEQWVRENYRKEVTQCRQRQARASTALVVMLDADTGMVEARSAQLSAALGPQRREDGELIAHLISKRNVETWVLCLSGHAVDEEANYKREPKIDGLINQAAAAFHDWSRRNGVVPQHCVDSLRQAIPEAQRIPPRNP